ncbi:hypothetical protein FAM09_19805 [Niastella caeni]|uniref:DUF5777 domain-containing protein n=1 Tax=Niastella caeni TaxID=2569763 RepID=A0A4S8HPA3_9BACT|nr:DUF5777 family beta-barrel protein [Niastella caeni]THU37197.1 hypothetical protein FAM09_19805 [Niastella caeni]
MNKITHILLLACFTLLAGNTLKAQDQDLLKMVDDSANTNTKKKSWSSGAFKSSRVINGQSMEMIGKGVLDVRILHRFGLLSNGAENFFGLDEASMRMGFDYGLTSNLTIGVGRSTLNKELDAFLKFRPVRQGTGGGSPVSIVWVSGITLHTMKWADTARKNLFSSRIAYYNQVIFGRKFSNAFSMQLSPIMVHRNLVTNADDENNTWALGIGARLKLTKRTAFVVDYHPILAGREPGTKDPLSVGFDIETGGHVFQLHFSNSTGMNEKAFLTGTTNDFWKGDIRFGFNLSRVFQVGKK